MSQCPICETENIENQSFCTVCGYELKDISEVINDGYIPPALQE